MQLVVTEKPSVAQAISHVIGAKERKDGYMEGNGFLVSWCVGHLVELAQPEMYSEVWKKWSYESTYNQPEPANQNVSWKDNQGNEGEILRNSFHNQESYYPVWIQENEITFRGTRLKDNAVPENGLWVGYCYPWGYADNHRNDKEGSNFKIDWAIDSNGESIVLDCIDFVKIMTAVNQDAGQMGEISTEVTTVENLHFKN